MASQEFKAVHEFKGARREEVFFLNRFEFLGDSSNRSTLRLDGTLEFDRMIG